MGECAGVSLDVIGAILNDAVEKIRSAKLSLASGAPADAGYHAYSAFITAAKALLLAEDQKCNTHIGILRDFSVHFADRFPEANDFTNYVLRIKNTEPNTELSSTYIEDANDFVTRAIATRERQLDKQVVSEYYKA